MDKKKQGGVIVQIDASKSDLDKAIAKRKKRSKLLKVIATLRSGSLRSA